MTFYHLRWKSINCKDSVFEVYCHEELIFKKYISFTQFSKPFSANEFMNFLNDLQQKNSTQYILNSIHGEESFLYNKTSNHLIFYTSNMKFILPDVHREELLHCFTQFYQHTISHE
jgi:hypothetical protein